MAKNFIQLLNDYTVEVPIIQRDYAQGREDEHSQNVCNNLLKDIKQAIGDKPLNLNFVYGKLQGNKFIPVDGQQRLTTLFLLHIYAYRNDETKATFLNKFTYETRISSREFFKKIIEHRKEIFKQSNLKDFIIDAEWFINGWEHDPTVKSAMTVFAKIVNLFSDIKEETLITALESDKIIFEFLDMQKLGMEDSLYIKLNARGKMLTPFENFKAVLSHIMNDLEYADKNDVEHKIDGLWLDYFWDKYKSDTDSKWLNIFRSIMLNNEYTAYANRRFNVSTDWHTALNEKFFDIVKYLHNFICDKKMKSVAKVFNDCGEDNASNEQLALLHIITVYLYENKGVVDNDKFFQWFRILRNLTRNTLTDKEDTYRRVLTGINNLSSHTLDILEYVANNKVTDFNYEQAVEEQEKAKIILLTDKYFNDAIYKAEEQEYFRGQIRCALYLAKNKNDNYDKAVFTKYWKVVDSCFDNNGIIDGTTMRRAMLSIADYTPSAGQTGMMKTFCPNYNSVQAKTASMMRLFSQNNPVVKKLLDELMSGKTYADVIKTNKLDPSDWRYCMVNYPKLFGKEFMSETHYRFCKEGKAWYLIPNEQPQGHIFDIHLAVIKEELAKANPKLHVVFDENRGRWNPHYLYIYVNEKGHYIYHKENTIEIRKDNKSVKVYNLDASIDYEKTAKDILSVVS